MDLKKFRNCDYGPLKFDFRNSTTLYRLRPISLLSSPFSSAQDGFKKQPKIFLESFVSVETKNALEHLLQLVMDKVTVTPLLSYVTSYVW